MITESEVLGKIGEHSFKIKSSIMKAVEHYKERLSDESLILSSLTKSSYIRDFILLYIEEAFRNTAQVEIKRKRGMILLAIKTNPIILLKFKKFNKGNRIASSRTFQAVAYCDQKQGELFPELINTVHLHSGYKWDETYTRVDCLIGFPNSLTGHSWIALIPESGKVKDIIETMPEDIIETKERKTKVKIKTQEDKNEKTA